jgi:hypothetical protein
MSAKREQTAIKFNLNFTKPDYAAFAALASGTLALQSIGTFYCSISAVLIKSFFNG